MIPMFREILLELCSACNRDCFFCPRHSDTSGHRKTADGKMVRKFMPTTMAEKILTEAHGFGFRGWVTFHHFSEPFLDERHLDMARLAKSLGMKPFCHTNGDALRNNEALCQESREVFDHLTVGLYDHKTPAERRDAEAFWRARLGPKTRFSAIDDVYVRGHHTSKNLDGYEAFTGRRPVPQVHPGAPCRRPLQRLIVHYTGNLALCCEDLAEEFELGSASETNSLDLWFSDRHVKIVQQLEAGNREPFSLCRSCPFPAG